VPDQENQAKDEDVDQPNSDGKEAYYTNAFLPAVNVQDTGDCKGNHQNAKVKSFEYAQI
jgi:hypothetical protein